MVMIPRSSRARPGTLSGTLGGTLSGTLVCWRRGRAVEPALARNGLRVAVWCGVDSGDYMEREEAVQRPPQDDPPLSRALGCAASPPPPQRRAYRAHRARTCAAVSKRITPPASPYE